MTASKRRLARVRNVSDMRDLARTRVPKSIFDFFDGAAEEETTRKRNRAQFNRWGFIQRAGIDVSTVDLSCRIMGTTYAAPFGIGPTGLAGLGRPRAESLLASAAASANIPFCLSTVASVSIEDAAMAGGPGGWMQLYIFRDRGLSRDLAARAKDSGYSTLVITVDCATGGNRERDFRNDFTMPLRPTWRNIYHTAIRPGWILRTLANGPPRPENMVEAASKHAKSAQSLIEFMSSQLDPSVTWQDIENFASHWNGPVVVKGLLAVEDVKRARDAGADGVILSNHGGRQLDGAVSPLTVLPGIRDAMGPDFTILCDSGFRRGADILKAVALGANAVLMGRNTLYGVAAAGETGAAHVIALLKEELHRAMTLLGTTDLSKVTPGHLMDLGHWDRSHI